MARHGLSYILGFLVLLIAAPIVQAQTTPSAPPLRLVLKGYDPVAYFTDGKPMQGKPEFETVFDGGRYRFNSAENMARFKSDPDKYVPQFSGACMNALSHGLKIEANPALWRIVDGKLFVFAGTEVPAQVDTNPHPMISKASENWKSLADKPF